MTPIPPSPRLLAPVLLLFAALLAGALAAQEGERPEGWMVRFDRPGSTEAQLETFEEMPPGIHITTGPAGIFWEPGMTADGTFRLELEVFLFDPRGRREGFGLFFGGSDLEGPDQAYGYFLLRDGGQFIVKRREGEEAPTVIGWTAHEAVRAWADRPEGEASVRNVLAVEAGTEEVRFLVNGEEVARLPRERIPVDGQVGVRVNHALDLHLARLEVQPLG